MTYNIRVATFTNGSTTFTATQANGVSVKNGSADGPKVVTHMVENDAGTIIDQFGIAVRTGTHCTQPLMDSLGIQGTIRASFAFYNTREEIDRLMEAIGKVEELFL